MKITFSAIMLFICLGVLTGVVYPLAVLGIAQLVFNEGAKGSILKVQDRIVGSRFIGQQFQDGKYFWSRPSANNYDGMKSGGTNFAPTSKELQKISTERRERLAIAHQSDLKSVPPDLIYASGSGLDPHITPEAAYYQVDRIAKARKLDQGDRVQQIKDLVKRMVRTRVGKYMGNPRVNVLRLNLELDELTEQINNG